MSRIHQSSSSRPSQRPPPSPSRPPPSPSRPGLSAASRTRATPSSPSPSLRTQASQKSLKTGKVPARRASPPQDEPPTPKPTLSIREQIALKRAEAQKSSAQSKPSRNDDAFGFGGLEDALPTVKRQVVDQDVDLGRWSVKETIERARTSGSVNLASRTLPCIPSALFEIHLGVKPEPLPSVPEEPPVSNDSESSASRRRGGQEEPSWYDAQDLEILKAWSNEIVEIQPEISMFGSLKIIDLHNNQIVSLPDSFADLTALTTLDLSHNKLASLPANLWALPNLTTLNISHNELTALPFREPFGPGSNPLARTNDSRGDWFRQTITRATTPLPRLTYLDASHNHLVASAIDHAPDADSLPASLNKLDLSSNPLGLSTKLLGALARLDRLRELRMEYADIGDESFRLDTFAASAGAIFPALRLLELGETAVTRPAVEGAFVTPAFTHQLEFEVTLEEPREGVLRVVLGKKVVKEAWELEAERRAKARGARQATAGTGSGQQSRATNGASGQKEVLKEQWEIEAEQGLFTEGARRRARAAAAAQSSQSSPSTPAQQKTSSPAEKEAWEIDAERGMLTAGAQRRARAAALAASATASDQAAPSRAASPTPSAPGTSSALMSPQYYAAATQTLTLPPSQPPAKNLHSRSFSLAPSLGAKSSSPGAASELALAIPTPTLPLATIVAQPLAQNLKILVLANRRADPSFTLPSGAQGPFLSNLEELSFENCNLGDNVPIVREDSAGRETKPLIALLTELFPSLRTLNLSYNALTSAALGADALKNLILASPAEQDGEEVVRRKGLRHLRLRGNRLAELDGLQELALAFKGNRNVPEWKLEELDLRDNEVGRLPAELGLLPLDVFLVDGNTFRVPPRRVWEREGTKGLLSWLRGRIE
ncbi:hypothetical protein CERSUDRAFT_100387 [Gelatoporia subvermispora B]|uniref:L domain-like protein n=1 Tax=Ceriporiopsis subvermispora (strain B) TaxID=914234 RepID=M2QYD0_CERS8|nr:hypothetical protein CERSUDRAFT_100387 [Gelatoporia subvermispora B]